MDKIIWKVYNVNPEGNTLKRQWLRGPRSIPRFKHCNLELLHAERNTICPEYGM